MAGEVAYKRGDLAAAADLLGKAIAADKKCAQAHWVLGNVNQDQGRLERAITSYRRALRAAPELAAAHNDLGTAYYAKGWYEEAGQCYRRTLELEPDHAGALENLATALRAQGKLKESRDAFIRLFVLRLKNGLRRLFGRKPDRRKASAPQASIQEIKDLIAGGRLAEAEKSLIGRLATSADDPDALHLLGHLLATSGRRDDGIRHLERAIALRSSTPEYYLSLGNALTDAKRYAQALEQYQAALLLDPGYGAAVANIARVLHELGHFREAEEVFRQSLEHDPDLAGAHSNLAGTLLSLGKYAEAEAAARKALGLNPKSMHARLMLASVMLDQGRLGEAQETIRSASTQDENNIHLLRWIGTFHMTTDGDLKSAEAILRRALAVAPEDASIRINLARVLLIQQRFAEGWEEYEWRRRDPARALVYTKFPYPEWNGEPLEGKTLVVNGEQGLGDEIMFASCLAEIAARAKRCVLLCSRRLEPLFRRSFPFAEVIGGSHALAEDPFPVLSGVDYQVPSASLPRSLRRSAADFPRHQGYLKADPEKIRKWRERLDALGPGMKIGLSWKGGTPLSDQTRRTMELAQFERLLELPGTHWISLQFGDCREERDAFTARRGARLHHWQEAIYDLDETAALICALDLRLSVCNTQVHISGALGKEIWVLTPLGPDWRYGHEGERMLWYPEAHLFRQPVAGDWQTPIAALSAALRERLSSGALSAASPRSGR
ncbi:MAG: tetratricopeptide repeat protein [Pseudomonadota bacterium]